jgi:hypothetical protein
MPGTVTLTHEKTGNVRKITATCVADAAAATFPDTVLPAFAGRLQHLETDPGATAPTTLYDITVEDAHALDVLQGVGANRSATVTERANIVYSGGLDHPYVSVSDVLTLKIGGNAVNSAIVVAELVYRSA